MKSTEKSAHAIRMKVIAIIGPTASGKTGLSIALAKQFGGEIVSADSRQVYIGLDIGTGKVTQAEMNGVPHHLLDVASPKRQYSVEKWRKEATSAVASITKRGNVPIVCGGTGLYVDALLRGLEFPSVAPDAKLRKRLERKTVSELFSILSHLDPRRAREIDRKNPRRLIRAIEIASALGKVPGVRAMETQYDVLWIGINPTDRALKANIHKRLIARMRQGMLAEAKRLHLAGLSYSRMRALGLEYRFLADFLEGNMKKEAMLSSLEHAIWQYAKRQRTWWKRYDDIHWLKSPDAKKALLLMKAHLE